MLPLLEQTVVARSLRHAFRLFNHVQHFLFGGGTWALSSCERVIVEAAIGFFPSEIQERLRKQLARPFFVERSGSGGRIHVLRRYGDLDELKVGAAEFADLLVIVRIAVDGKEENAHVTFYKGFLFSIEFRRPSSVYLKKSLAVKSVRLGKTKQSFTNAIDRLEHGRSPE